MRQGWNDFTEGVGMEHAQRQNVISVTGYGRLFAAPNYFTIGIAVGCRSNSMKASHESVNADMRKLFEIAAKYAVDAAKINVVDLTFGPAYEWKNNAREFLGYDVDQRVTIELDAVKENEEKAMRILGLVAALKYLKTCDVAYGLREKKKYLERVRELAFRNAQEKAEQYAALAGVRIVKANAIIDEEAVGEYARSNAECCDALDESAGEAYLPNGRRMVLEHTVYVVFDIERA